MNKKNFFTRMCEKFDPLHQGPLFFKWTWVSLVGVFGAAWLLYLWRDGGIISSLFENIFVYVPQYFTHEFAHRIARGLTHCNAIGVWSGPMTELFFPIALLLVCWRMHGGRWLSSLVLYYLATCFHHTAVYCGDARAMTLHLTYSDFISTAGPGTPGDWYNMLGPLGLLEWDTTFAAIFYFCGAVCMVLTFYSAWYYWNHTAEYLLHDANPSTRVVTQNPGEYNPGFTTRITQEDYERDPFTGERFNNPWDELTKK